jgi:hypothetical protein
LPLHRPPPLLPPQPPHLPLTPIRLITLVQ